MLPTYLYTALIGYWIAPFCAIAMTEHFLFRRSYTAYAVHAAWDDARHPNLPRAWPSLCALAVSIVFIVLCMQQEWWTGPVAQLGTGDLGMILGFVVSALVYAAARALERRWQWQWQWRWRTPPSLKLKLRLRLRMMRVRAGREGAEKAADVAEA